MKQIRRKCRVNIAEWVQQETTCEDRFQAIHFACYFGKAELIRSLHRFGADLSCTNAKSLTPVHVAAQADEPFAITYLYRHGASVDVVDQEKMNPLHWACHAGADRAIYYLLAWTKDINAQDMYGRTALHMAIEKIERFDHVRPIKELILKGASREIKTYPSKDSKVGQRPVEIFRHRWAGESKQPLKLAGVEDYEEMDAMLERQPFSIPCVQFRQPLIKLERSNTLFALYIVLVFSTFLELHLFCFPFPRYHWLVLPANILFVVIQLFFFTASTMNAGTVEKKKGVEFEKLVEKCDPNGLCPSCETIFTRDSRHCYFCNRCVHSFDHHCTWINNCVGSRNYWPFFFYIFLLLGYFILCVILSLYYIFTHEESILSEKEGYNWLLGKPSEDLWLFNVSPIITDPKQVASAQMTVLVEVAILSFLFCWPLSLLVYVQCMNIINGSTTKLRFGKSKYKQVD